MFIVNGYGCIFATTSGAKLAVDRQLFILSKQTKYV